MNPWITTGVVILALSLAFGSGWTIKGRLMQAAIDHEKVLAQIKATEETLQNSADEQKARLDAQQAEDILNALPDTGAVCINPEWVR